MQNFLSLWLNAGAQITHGGQVQRPRQKKDVRKKLDCLVVQVDIVLTRKEFEVMPYLRVFDGAALRIFKNTFNTMEVFYKKRSKAFDTFYSP